MDDDYDLDSWNIRRRVKLIKKLNSSLKKLSNRLNIDIPQAEIVGNKILLHILYFKNFMSKTKQEETLINK